jgi:hypothetical protein
VAIRRLEVEGPGVPLPVKLYPLCGWIADARRIHGELVGKLVKPDFDTPAIT